MLQLNINTQEKIEDLLLLSIVQVLQGIFGDISTTDCARHLVSTPSLMSTPSDTLQSQFQGLGEEACCADDFSAVLQISGCVSLFPASKIVSKSG